MDGILSFLTLIPIFILYLAIVIPSILIGLIRLFFKCIRNVFIKNAFRNLYKENIKYYIFETITDVDYFYTINIKETRIPSLFLLPSFIKVTKESLGYINCKIYKKSINKYNYFSIIKSHAGSIFFYPYKYNKKFLKNIHLYDIRDLKENEVNSILNLNISEYQKFILQNKFNKSKKVYYYD